MDKHVSQYEIMNYHLAIHKCVVSSVIADKETNGDAACYVGTSKLQYVPLSSTQGFSNLCADTIFVAHLPQTTAFLIPFSQ